MTRGDIFMCSSMFMKRPIFHIKIRPETKRYNVALTVDVLLCKMERNVLREEISKGPHFDV